MNRLVLIGNGFDLAHGLKTSYKDFIYWYWKQRVLNLRDFKEKTSDDGLCKFSILNFETWYSFFYYNPIDSSILEDKDFFEVTKNKEEFGIEYSPLFERIHKSIETKGWVDIENDYYELLKECLNDNAPEEEIVALHSELQLLQEKLVEYLTSINVSDELLNAGIRPKIYEPFKRADISISGQQALNEHIKAGLELSDNEWEWKGKLRQYGSNCNSKWTIEKYQKNFNKINPYKETEEPDELMLPNKIMLLTFNYTHTAELYCKKEDIFTVNHIHGDLDIPASVIFGYGDELDEDFKTLLKRNNNKYLSNIKSIKYLEADSYRKMLSFIESEPYQILIMGHSCGNSDRTLLNTLFEHKNCVSIKPYYYQIDKDKDNYIDLVQNISRNFTDMKLMRDRVVNKTSCVPLT